MTDNMKKFMEAASKDEAMKAELQALADNKVADVKAATIEFAAKHGFTLTAEDFEASEMEEFTEDELEAVAGGICVCPLVGGGTGNGKQCACVFGGEGEDDDGHTCSCPLVGAAD